MSNVGWYVIWLSNISVWFDLTKRDSEKKVTKWPAKFLSFTNPGVQPWQLRLQENLKMAGGADFWSRGSLYCYIQFEFLRSTGISWLWRAKLSKVTNTWHTECGRCLHCLLFLLHRHQLSDHKLYIWDMSPFCNNPHNMDDHCWCNISRPKQPY